MKVKGRKDSTDTKLQILNVGSSISYNMAADSLRFSELGLSYRTQAGSWLNIGGAASFNLYKFVAGAGRINKFLWSTDKKIAQLTSFSINVSTNLQGGQDESIKKDSTKKVSNQSEYAGISGEDVVDFSIPWSLNFSYSLRFQQTRKADYSGYTTDVFQDVNWSGTLALTEKWQLGLNGFYNITQKELGTISISIAREMHCWQMAINVSPVGHYRFFSITISPKSALLRDIKVNRTRYFYDL